MNYLLQKIKKLARIYSTAVSFIDEDLFKKYEWMIPVFEMFFDYSEGRNVDEVNSWLEYNQFELESILSTFPDPKFIGKGNNGVAYIIGEDQDKIIKFVNKNDYEKAIEIQNKLYSGDVGAEYLPNIYYYGDFEAPNKNNPDIYYVIMEKAVVRPKSVEYVESSVHQDYRQLKKIMENNIFNIIDENIPLETMVRHVYNKIIIDMDHNTLDRIVNLLGNGNYQWLFEIIKSSILQIQQGNFDLHWQNFGQRHNQPTTPVVFDA